MYKCMDCGEVFDEYTADWKVHDEMACPSCYSTDYDDAMQCKKCGDWFTDDEGVSELCDDCLEFYKISYRHSPQKLYKLTEDLEEKVEINYFLASVFTKEEIEKVLLKELVIASATKLPDYISFIEQDQQAFAEWIEEVIENEQKNKS